MCVIAQVAASDAAGKKVLLGTVVDFLDSRESPTIRFRFTPDAQKQQGVKVSFDSGVEFKLPIRECDTSKCEAFGRMNDQLLKEFNSGRVARVTFVSASSGEVTAPVSLAGFGPALESLKNPPPKG